MPAGRILLKSISESKKLSLLKTDGARLLFTWMIPHLDVNGCFSGDPAVVNGKIFTRLEKTHQEVNDYLNDLAVVGLLVRYQSNGDTFLHVPSFRPKQPNLNPDREGRPFIPPPTPEQLKTNSGAVTEFPNTSKVNISKVKSSKEKVESKTEFDPLFEQFWKGYPKKVAKEVAREKFLILARAGKMPELIKATNGYLDFLKHKRIKENFDQEPMNPATFLMKNRWQDYVDFKYEPPM